MTADQPRDWDRELAAIDKVLEKQRAGAPPGPTALPPGSIERVPPTTPRPAPGRGSVATVAGARSAFGVAGFGAWGTSTR